MKCNSATLRCILIQKNTVKNSISDFSLKSWAQGRGERGYNIEWNFRVSPISFLSKEKNHTAPFAPVFLNSMIFANQYSTYKQSVEFIHTHRYELVEYDRLFQGFYLYSFRELHANQKTTWHNTPNALATLTTPLFSHFIEKKRFKSVAL